MPLLKEWVLKKNYKKAPDILTKRQLWFLTVIQGQCPRMLLHAACCRKRCGRPWRFTPRTALQVPAAGDVDWELSNMASFHNCLLLIVSVKRNFFLVLFLGRVEYLSGNMHHALILTSWEIQCLNDPLRSSNSNSTSRFRNSFTQKSRRVLARTDKNW